MVSNKPGQTAGVCVCVCIENDNTQNWLKTFEDQTFLLELEVPLYLLSPS